MKKLFKNYKKWCKYLDRKSSLWLPTIQQEVQQRKLLYMGLYLLIWGEAANLRFMPECLCYIYHHKRCRLELSTDSVPVVFEQLLMWLRLLKLDFMTLVKKMAQAQDCLLLMGIASDTVAHFFGVTEANKLRKTGSTIAGH